MSAKKLLQYILILFLTTRLALTIIGITSQALLEPFRDGPDPWKFSQHKWLSMWGVWDSGWYEKIAENGYSPNPAQNDAQTRFSGTIGQASYAFFPLYPMLMAMLGFFTKSAFSAGILISNLALLTSCFLLYKLIKLDEDNQTALFGIKYLFLFPTAFIFSGVFTESLFLMLLLATFYFARKKKWLYAGIAGFFLALTKSIGVFVFLPLLIEYFYQNKNNAIITGNEKPNKKVTKLPGANIFYLLMIPLGLAIFSLYNYFLTENFFAFINIQSAWDRKLFNFFPHNIFDYFSLAFTAITLLLIIFFIKKIRLSYVILSIGFIFIPLLSGLISMPRQILPIFPLYLILAQISKNKLSDQALTILFALFQGFLAIFWVNGFNLII